jgi:hypothetical protein
VHRLFGDVLDALVVPLSKGDELEIKSGALGQVDEAVGDRAAVK